MGTLKQISRLLRQVTIIFILMTGNLYSESNLSEELQRRVSISVSIFPKIVATDTGITTKLIDNQINLAVAYKTEKAYASALVADFNQRINKIRSSEAITQIVSIKNLSLKHNNFSAIFLAEVLSDQEFAKLLAYAIKHHIILFSPFPGDVERGAIAGIAIEARIRPFFNLNSLKRAQIEISQTLIRISRTHE
ncbi:MAG: YfiR family protein [Gammaproteobacteria bacterium]|nr:YfiR family protein [Gammaproteobacteria bacterium]